MIENKTRTCKITIYGETYSLVTSESEEHLVIAAKMVDSLMREIVNKAPHTEEKKCALLAALRIASKVLLLEAEKEQGALKEQHLIKVIEQELG